MSQQKYTFATYGILKGASFFSDRPGTCEPFEIGTHYLTPLFEFIGSGCHRLVDEWITSTGWDDREEPSAFSTDEAASLAQLLLQAIPNAEAQSAAPDDLSDCANDLATYLISAKAPYIVKE